MKKDNSRELLTVEEAAEMLRLSVATIRAWIFQRKHLEVVRLGRAVRISNAAVERFISANTVVPVPGENREAQRSSDEC